MLQRFRALRKSESGFTLTELLIVIIILGILTGVVVFAVQAFSDRGEVAACKTDIKTVETAVEAYYAKFNAYPTSAQTGQAGVNARFQLLVTNGYLHSAPSSASYAITLTDTGQVSGRLTPGGVPSGPC